MSLELFIKILAKLNDGYLVIERFTMADDGSGCIEFMTSESLFATEICFENLEQLEELVTSLT